MPTAVSAAAKTVAPRGGAGCSAQRAERLRVDRGRERQARVALGEAHARRAALHPGEPQRAVGAEAAAEGLVAGQVAVAGQHARRDRDVVALALRQLRRRHEHVVVVALARIERRRRVGRRFGGRRPRRRRCAAGRRVGRHDEGDALARLAVDPHPRVRFERGPVKREVGGERQPRAQLARRGVVFAGQPAERDPRGLERPGQVVGERAAAHVAQALGDGDAHPGRGRPGAVGLEADHARGEEAEAARQRRLEREVGQHRGLVGRLQPRERDQVVGEADPDLGQRADLTGRRDGRDRRPEGRHRQGRDDGQRFGSGRGVPNAAGRQQRDQRCGRFQAWRARTVRSLFGRAEREPPSAR